MLDVGCGAGTETLVAAQMVAPDGHVTGVDMTPEMLAKARAATGEMDAANVEFVEGEVDVHEAIGAINRPQFVNLVADWLASIPEVDTRLRAQPPACVADLACGTAWSSIAIARAYPEVMVEAIDLDAESIETAGQTSIRSWVAATTWSPSSRPCTT